MCVIIETKLHKRILRDDFNLCLDTTVKNEGICVGMMKNKNSYSYVFQFENSIPDYFASVCCSLVFEVFERLNMGAVQLNEMELRNCIYHGSYCELLQSLAASDQMKTIMQVCDPFNFQHFFPPTVLLFLVIFLFQRTKVGWYAFKWQSNSEP